MAHPQPILARRFTWRSWLCANRTELQMIALMGGGLLVLYAVTRSGLALG
jgi:hypothetical protein